MSNPWGELIVLPVIIIGILSVVCTLHILASPRIFRHRICRIIAALAFLAYGAMIFAEAQFLSHVGQYVSAWTFLRWVIQIIPLAMALWLMQRIERARRDMPIKGAFWKKDSQPSDA